MEQHKHIRRPGRPAFTYRSKTDSHRITLNEKENQEVWSLFIRFGLKRRIWGFWREDLWQPAKVQSRKSA